MKRATILTMKKTKMMKKICNVCKQEKEHKSWKSTTCNDCLAKGIKWCSSCHETKLITEYHTCRGKPLGMCKMCECNRSKENKNAIGYYSRAEVKERRRATSKQWHREHDEEHKQEIYAKHNARKRERYATDADYKESVIASNRAYKDKLQGDLTGKDWIDILSVFNNSCAYCGAKVSLTRDHVIPVSKGGINTKHNIVPACKSCNSSKHNNDVVEWYKHFKYFSNERLAKIMKWIGGDAL